MLVSMEGKCWFRKDKEKKDDSSKRGRKKALRFREAGAARTRDQATAARPVLGPGCAASVAVVPSAAAAAAAAAATNIMISALWALDGC